MTLAQATAETGEDRERGIHPIDLHVGRQIRIRRKLLGLTQTTLGTRLGVTFQQIQKYERGFTRVSASRLWELAEVLDVPISYFFEGARDYTALHAAAETDDGEEVTLPGTADSEEIQEFFSALKGIRNARIRKAVLDLSREMARVSA